MNIIGCLDTADEGNYYIDGQNVVDLSGKDLSIMRNRKIGFIFQQFNLISKLDAYENVELPLIYQGLATRPTLILADEPTGNLDSRSSKDIMKLIHELHNQGNTIVLITHDNDIAVEAPRQIKLLDGKIVLDKQKNKPEGSEKK